MNSVKPLLRHTAVSGRRGAFALLASFLVLAGLGIEISSSSQHAGQSTKVTADLGWDNPPASTPTP
jgi:hypothetical protein